MLWVAYLALDQRPSFSETDSALLSPQEALGSEPFLLMLGDHLYRSTHAAGSSCTRQLIDAFQVREMMLR